MSRALFKASLIKITLSLQRELWASRNDILLDGGVGAGTLLKKFFGNNLGHSQYCFKTSRCVAYVQTTDIRVAISLSTVQTCDFAVIYTSAGESTLHFHKQICRNPIAEEFVVCAEM